jgi:hypothetical protein
MIPLNVDLEIFLFGGVGRVIHRIFEHSVSALVLRA